MVPDKRRHQHLWSDLRDSGIEASDERHYDHQTTVMLIFPCTCVLVHSDWQPRLRRLRGAVLIVGVVAVCGISSCMAVLMEEAELPDEWPWAWYRRRGDFVATQPQTHTRARAHTRCTPQTEANAEKHSLKALGLVRHRVKTKACSDTALGDTCARVCVCVCEAPDSTRE